jgi:hypothetical protein
MESDDLSIFLQWVLNDLPSLWAIPKANSVWRVGEVMSTLLYREAPYQVQMFSVPENTIIPEHTHPNVDSYEVYLGGNIRFSFEGEYVHSKEELETDEDGLCKARGSIIRVRPNNRHGGVFGPGGGVFLSVQKWLNGVQPHCVAMDYVGVCMNEDHYNSVVSGEPELKSNLTEKDVVPLTTPSD